MLPKDYAWLAREPGPKMLLEALKFHGLKEGPGAADNPVIMGWADALGPGIRRIYTADSVPWCGLFIAAVARLAGKPPCAQPLWARAWASWGEKSPRAALGDVLVFVRPGGGHVGLYIGETARSYCVLGGNQGDAVSFAWIAKSRCIAARRSYAVAPPQNVRVVRLKTGGALSVNEA